MSINPYVASLIELKEKEHHDLKEVKDQWRTPDPEFYGIERFVCGDFGCFTYDLFTDGQNSKCPNYYTPLTNALVQPWAKDLAASEQEGCVLNAWAFANPPYSRPFEWEGDNVTGMHNIMAKAAAERDAGARICFLVKSATSESWWPDSLSEYPADRIIPIKGRLSFQLPVWCRPKGKSSSAGFGGTLVIFNKESRDDPRLDVDAVSRKTLVELGEELCKANEDRRKEWIESFDEL